MRRPDEEDGVPVSTTPRVLLVGDGRSLISARIVAATAALAKEGVQLVDTNTIDPRTVVIGAGIDGLDTRKVIDSLNTLSRPGDNVRRGSNLSPYEDFGSRQERRSMGKKKPNAAQRLLESQRERNQWEQQKRSRKS